MSFNRYPKPPVFRLLEAILGGYLRGERHGQQIVLRHAPREGCAIFFVIPWCIAWTAFIVMMARDVEARPDLRGIFWLAVMAAIDVAALAFVLYSLFATDELRLDQNRLIYFRRVLLPIRRRELLLTRVEKIDLLDAASGVGTKAAIQIQGDGDTIVFGKGVDPEELGRWARLLLEQVHKAARHTMPPAAEIIQTEEAKRSRHQEAVKIVLQSMHVRPEQIAANLALRRKVKARVGNAEVHLRNEERWPGSDAYKPPSMLQKIANVGLFALLVPFLIVLGIVWVTATTGLIAQFVTGANRHWNRFLLIPLFLLITIWWIRAAWKVIASIFRRVAAWLRRSPSSLGRHG